MMTETIKELFERKLRDARDEVRNSHIRKDQVIAKADQEIAVATAKRDQLENLVDLDWEKYAKWQLGQSVT